MRAILLLLLALTVSGCTGCVSLSEKRVHTSALRLDFKEGKCSGTAIGPHKVLSAAHCFAKDSGEMKVNGQATGYTVTARDGADHVLVVVQVRLTHWVAVGTAPTVGQSVYFYGNPGNFNDLFRRGYVSGTVQGYTLYDMQAWFGDSGAGVFDARGNVVAVVSSIAIESQALSPGTFQMMASAPFKFTDEQWAA